MRTTSDRRWPHWVYRDGDEPDPRFSFANERTFLAWIRTSLALISAGVAVGLIPMDVSVWGQRLIAATLITLGMGCAGLAWVRWARAEQALRRSQPLPSMPGALVVALALALCALLLLVA